MLPLIPQDWTKVLDQKMAIRMARNATDTTGHAYGLHDTPFPASHLTAVEKLRLLARPDDWYDRLFNTMSLIAEYAVGEPSKNGPQSLQYLLLLRNTRCDHEWFKATGLHRGEKEGLSFPRVNLSLCPNVAVVDSQFLDSPHPQLARNEIKIEAFCDSVIRMINAAPVLAAPVLTT